MGSKGIVGEPAFAERLLTDNKVVPVLPKEPFRTTRTVSR
jgi:hypothetical protein